MRKLLRKIIIKYGVADILSEIALTRKKKAWFAAVSSADDRYYENAIAKNFQNDRSKIQVGKNSAVRGQLKVLKYGGEIHIGENSYIGNNSEVWSGCKVVIGNNVLISDRVFITDTNSHEINYLERAQTFLNILASGLPDKKGSIEVKQVVIKDYVWINYGAIILKGVTIGKGAIVGAGSVVTKDVEDFTFVAGNPAKFIKRIEQ